MLGEIGGPLKLPPVPVEIEHGAGGQLNPSAGHLRGAVARGGARPEGAESSQGGNGLSSAVVEAWPGSRREKPGRGRAP